MSESKVTPELEAELRGMERVVEYLCQRAERLYGVAARMTAESEADQELQYGVRLKALSLVEAAGMVRDGIRRAREPLPEQVIDWKQEEALKQLIECLSHAAKVE